MAACRRRRGGLDTFSMSAAGRRVFSGYLGAAP